jgi:tetratricopeptide (TPR) repeat protein
MLQQAWRQSQGLEFASQRSALLLQLAEIRHRQGRKTDAGELVKQAVAVCESRADCWRDIHSQTLIALANLRLDEGRRADAESALDEAANLEEPLERDKASTLVQATYNLTQIARGFTKLSQDAKAEKVYRRIISLRGALSSSQNLEDAEKGLAELCAKKGRRAEAKKLYSDAAAIAKRRGQQDREARLLDAASSLP